MRSNIAEKAAKKAAKSLVELFRQRFGDLTPRQVERMRSADAATRDRWLVDVFTAASLNDLLT